MDKDHNEIIKMSHAWFSDKDISPENIFKFIKMMSRGYQREDLDEDWLFRKIESIHQVVMGDATSLDDNTGHEEWFNPSTDKGINRDFEWHFWDHYSDYLIVRKGWSPRVVEGIDRLTNEILSKIEDPQRPGRWDRRGMVMGSVQSGKTANYTGLITKAADAGYKLFIILAGVHNSLRSQTQMRLAEEFMGYEMETIQKLTGKEKRIGVREMFEDHGTVFTLTNSSEKGDFKRSVAAQQGIFPAMDSPPIILIIKKHVSILKNLIEWLPSVIGQKDRNGRSIIKDIPMILIDDECDYASINTKEPHLDENQEVCSEWDPTATNRHIRAILHMFDKSTYLGYTATPYANIFIHMEEKHPVYGEDLFPRSFIINLPQPNNYMGPEHVFGLDASDDTGIVERDPLPIIRLINDSDSLIPPKHKKDLDVPHLPESLRYAIKTFLLTCASRNIRAEGNPHNSMLIHVTRYTNVQRQIYELVEMQLQRLAARIMSGRDLQDFEEIWRADFSPTSSEMAERDYTDAIIHSWEDIKSHLQRATRVVRVKLINGTAKDSIDYHDSLTYANDRIKAGEDVPWEERGASFIVIGGDKLSRGLTLEGLSVSYYLRASRMYDTLMQMGRWFGYREGYTDLCRIFTTGELLFWYRHIAGANVELRNEIDYMAALGATPEKFGLKIKSHPGRLVVTSAGKSRKKQKIQLSYAGNISETVVFDPHMTDINKDALERLIEEIGRSPDYPVMEKKPRFRWSGVPSGPILNFLTAYKTNEEATRIADPMRWAQYIEKQNRKNELISWDVVIVSTNDKEHSVEIEGLGIGCNRRKTWLPITKSKVSIKRLVSPADETIDLTEEEIEMARQICGVGPNSLPSGKSIRGVRPPSRGLMLIYLLYGYDKKGKPYGLDSTYIGLALSYPESKTAVPIEYWVNPIYISEEDKHGRDE